MRMQNHNQEIDWWWQLRYGMCYYKLGLFQEAIRHFDKSLELRQMDETVLHLNKAHLRTDQPLVVAAMFKKLSDEQPGAALPTWKQRC
jgi:tetratricopeptide (TPR) repeat protein